MKGWLWRVLLKKSIDFDDIFSPVIKMSFIRSVLGLVTSLNLEIEQRDMKTNFLTWWSWWDNLHGVTKRIWSQGKGEAHMQGKEELVLIKTNYKTLV